MKTIKIISVVGARPQFVKLSPLARAAASGRGPGRSLKHLILHTGQHYDDKMSRVFFDELEIPRPDYDLGVGSGSHARQTGKMMVGIEKILREEKPDWVLVYGDTNSTLAGALAAAKLRIPIGHIEAGLRSFNRGMPEEINRVAADRVSDILFCPTQTAVKNLGKEGFKNIVNQGRLLKEVHLSLFTLRFPSGQALRPFSPRLRSGPAGKAGPASHLSPLVVNVGDIMYDSILFYLGLAEKRSRIIETLDLHSSYCLATVHRAESTDNLRNLKAIILILKEIAKQGIQVVFPVHPRTRKIIQKNSSLRAHCSGFSLLDPVPYLDMLRLEQHARFILTDSGGVQKEAYWLRVPCLTIRNETEWVETLGAGANVLVGYDRDKTLRAVKNLPQARRDSGGIYGNGHAAERIIQVLKTCSG